MNRLGFRDSANVTAFTDWFAKRYSGLSISLDIKRSRFVPHGIQAELIGLDELVWHYCWRTQESDSGDWAETQVSLRKMGDALKQAIDSKRDKDVLAACRDILAWGGNRNPRNGALPFLDNLHAQGKLADYLSTTRQAFALEGAVIDPSRPHAAKMNSMLTKVHALASTDGLPIYDSRVAAAIATLVELWRHEQALTHTPLPPELTFPATTLARSVFCLFDDARDPGVMSYAPGALAVTAARWSSAKIRLGWLMAAILEKAPHLFGTAPAPERMHAFEASLFMIGYDVSCLQANRSSAGRGQFPLARLQKAGVNQLRQEHEGLQHKSICTLTGYQQNIHYAGDAETGFSGVWSDTSFAFDSEFLQDLLSDFPKGHTAGLGAAMDGTVAPDTLGHWIDQHYPRMSRRFVSALAPILVAEGLAERCGDTRPIRLEFL